MAAWHVSWRADPRARALADRHYNRQSVGHAQFVPPGRCLVLLTAAADALWVSSAPRADYVKHEWAGAWTCTTFRNEGPLLSSGLIVEAVAATLARWGEPPALGMVTFIDPREVESPNPGYCFLCAGFRRAGWTSERGLLALLLAPEAMPGPAPAAGHQLELA